MTDEELEKMIVKLEIDTVIEFIDFLLEDLDKDEDQ